MSRKSRLGFLRFKTRDSIDPSHFEFYGFGVDSLHFRGALDPELVSGHRLHSIHSNPGKRLSINVTVEIGDSASRGTVSLQLPKKE